MTNEELVRELKNAAEKWKCDNPVTPTFGIRYDIALHKAADALEKRRAEYFREFISVACYSISRHASLENGERKYGMLSAIAVLTELTDCGIEKQPIIIEEKGEKTVRFRKKPVVIEAVQWTGTNQEDILTFCDAADFDENGLKIHTLEGDHFATVGDYIIKGVRGEFYPCKPDIFHETYEALKEETQE